MIRATLFRRRPGFTLVELLVVVALMVVLLAIGASVYPNLANSQKVVRSGDRLSGWLLIAKARAKRDGAPRGLRLYVTNDPQTSQPTRITECQYIEAPLAWSPNPTQNANGAPTDGRIVFVQMHQFNPGTGEETVPDDRYRKCYFVGTDAELAEFDLRVKLNDQLYLPDYGSSHRIIDIEGTGSMNGTAPQVGLPAPTNLRTARVLTLASYPYLGAATSGALNTLPTPPPGRIPLAPPPTGTLVTYNFAFQTAPQTLMGEPILLLGTSTIIDWRAPLAPSPAGGPSGYRDWSNPRNATGTPNAGPYHPSTTIGLTNFVQDPAGPPGQGFIDILFGPGGQVLNNPNGLICLWLRDPELTPHPRQESPTVIDTPALFNAAGEQMLVVINTRSGLISTKPVAEPPGAPQYGFDPYQFAKDGLDTGL